MSAEGVVFREEFQRLMRALYDSLEREGELQRQLRRTKETLISVALRLQVAVKVSQEDELTITALQQQAADSKTKEILANRNAQDAADMVTSLTFEINQLRRKLKIAEGDRNNATTPGGNLNPNSEAYQMSYAAADSEVDDMLGRSNSFAPTKFVDKPLAESATPFERWKMNQFIYSPDTPAASEEYDRQVVQMLLEASAQEFSEDYRKPTKSGIAKLKRLNQMNTPLKPLTSTGSRTQLITTVDGGANVYETVGVNVLESSDLPPHSAIGGARRGQEEKIYFLEKSAPGAMWGSTAAKAMQRTQSLSGTPGFGAGRDDMLMHESATRPGTMSSRYPSSPLKGIRPGQGGGSSPDHKRSSNKGINSIIV